MKNITDVIEYLIKQDRKDLVEAVVRELRSSQKVVERYTPPPAPMNPINPLQPWKIGDDPSKPGVIC